MLKVDAEFNKGILFVRLNGSLNRRTIYKVNNYLIPIILKNDIKYLVYNFYDLKSIDEDGMEAILNTKYAIKNNKGKLYLCETNTSLKKQIKKLHIKNLTNELKAFKKMVI